MQRQHDMNKFELRAEIVLHANEFALRFVGARNRKQNYYFIIFFNEFN